MAANFWASTHGQNWLLNRQQLLDSRQEDLKYINESELYKLNMWFAYVMTELGRRLSVRQVIISTAITYFKRFYVKNSYRNTEPMLVLTACMYLATKIEEFPLHIKTVISEARALKISGGITNDIQKVAEMEFYLLEELNFNMIVFHPYRSLIQISKDFGIKHEDVKMASYIINDMYRTDLCLLYPPYVIAIAALFLPIAIKEKSNLTIINGNSGNNDNVYDENDDGDDVGDGSCKEVRKNLRKLIKNEEINNLCNGDDRNGHKSIKDIKKWFSELNIDMEQVVDIVQELIVLYDFWSEYEEDKSSEIDVILKKLL